MTDAQKSILELMAYYDLTDFQQKPNLYEQIVYLDERIGGDDLISWLLPLYKEELMKIETKDIFGGENNGQSN
jgi:hypothetical protein